MSQRTAVLVTNKTCRLRMALVFSIMNLKCQKLVTDTEAPTALPNNCYTATPQQMVDDSCSKIQTTATGSAELLTKKPASCRLQEVHNQHNASHECKIHRNMHAKILQAGMPSSTSKCFGTRHPQTRDLIGAGRCSETVACLSKVDVATVLTAS